jgi:hypothetical protein
LGLFDSLLKLPVKPTEGRILYLAMDRPQQARRAGARLFSSADQGTLRERLAVWQGPLPVDVLKAPGALADWIVQQFGSEVSEVHADSLKDMASKLSDDSVGSGLNSAIQEVIARGINWVSLHHQRKASGDNKKPNALADIYGSRWLTAGHGSVMMLSRPTDTADNDVVEVRQLKEPMEKISPFLARHDRTTGRTQFVMDLKSTTAQAANDRRARIAAYVLAGGTQGREQSDICAAIGGRKQLTIDELHAMHNDLDLRLKKVGRTNTWYDINHAPVDAV